jgi:hypothetical protein
MGRDNYEVDEDNYEDETAKEFVRDMKKAGFLPYHYRGRFSWEGPAVDFELSDKQFLIRSTKVQLQFDSMGLGGVAYPVQPARPWRDK